MESIDFSPWRVRFVTSRLWAVEMGTKILLSVVLKALPDDCKMPTTS